MNKRPEWWEWTEKDIEDTVNHLELGGGLLWDQCKECGIKDEIDET